MVTVQGDPKREKVGCEFEGGWKALGEVTADDVVANAHATFLSPDSVHATTGTMDSSLVAMGGGSAEKGEADEANRLVEGGLVMGRREGFGGERGASCGREFVGKESEADMM
jgi:hypothetical protein